MMCSSHHVLVCSSPHVLLLYGVFLTPKWKICTSLISNPPTFSYSSSEAPPSVKKAPSPAFQVLSSNHHTLLLEMTRKAADRWRAIGIELGFKKYELDDMLLSSRNHLYEESRSYGDEMYYGKEVCYAAMLRRWLDWAPPNHSPPTLSALVAAMRAVGMESVAFDLELQGKELTGKCCAVMRFLEVTSWYCNDMQSILMIRHNISLA